MELHDNIRRHRDNANAILIQSLAVIPQVRREMAPIAAAGAWNMGQWESMGQYVGAIEPHRAPSTSATAFLRAVLDVHCADFRSARGEACMLPDD